MPHRQTETPHRNHGQHQDDDVEKHIRDGGTEQRGVIVDALTVRIGTDPGRFDGDALEYVGQHERDAPARDEGEEHVAGVLEGFAHSEEPVVEEQDGYFDEGNADAVEDFVGDGCLFVEGEWFSRSWGGFFFYLGLETLELTLNSSTTLAWGTVSKCRPTPFRASAWRSEHGFWICRGQSAWLWGYSYRQASVRSTQTTPPTNCVSEHTNKSRAGGSSIALTRLDIMTASSHQKDSVETRLDARRKRTAEVESTMRPIHVPMTMWVLS